MITGNSSPRRNWIPMRLYTGPEHSGTNASDCHFIILMHSCVPRVDKHNAHVLVLMSMIEDGIIISAGLGFTKMITI